MNKAGLVDAITERVGSRAAATAAVEALVETITTTVARGEKVGISGFGVFEKVQRAARTARNPSTGDAVPLEPTAVPKFRPGKGFKELVRDSDEVRPRATGKVPAARDGAAGRARAAKGTTRRARTS